ncbi:MAG: hypothetical protein ISR61_01705 [Desulfobacteraceae bacterium]|nr:hypothetical protein [Desulfobacteraceae bacterium]
MLRRRNPSVQQTQNLEIDVAAVGSPFLTLEEFFEVADMLDERKGKGP